MDAVIAVVIPAVAMLHHGLHRGEVVCVAVLATRVRPGVGEGSVDRDLGGVIDGCGQEGDHAEPDLPHMHAPRESETDCRRRNSGGAGSAGRLTTVGPHFVKRPIFLNPRTA